MNELAKQLQAPFDPALVGFRPQGALNDQGKGRVVAYVDARAVMDRLDEVYGPEGWSFTWEPLILGKAIEVVKGTITVGAVSKSDVGDGGDTEPSKSAVSDALKRAAVHWGVGRYLYDLKTYWVKGKVVGKSWVPEDAEIERLRAGLPRTEQPRSNGHVPAASGPSEPVPASTSTEPANAGQIRRLAELGKQLNLITADNKATQGWRDRLKGYNVNQSQELTTDQAQHLIEQLEAETRSSSQEAYPPIAGAGRAR